MTVFEPNKDARVASRWVPFLDGWITGTGAPSRARLERWSGQGVTDVVTLQRTHERAPWLQQVCSERAMAWHHAPLSGKRLREPEDLETIARLPALVAELRARAAPRIVVHCSAGMHRTGAALFMMMRLAGLSAADALARIDEARPITAHELTRRTRRGVLLERVEQLYATLDGVA